MQLAIVGVLIVALFFFREGKMTDQTPQEAINRGLKLGILLLVLFIISATLMYVVAGLIGISGTAQLIAALFIGPVIASVIFGFWWNVSRRNADE